MADLEWMLGVIMLSGFLFAAVVRFNLHWYLESKKMSLTVDKQAYLDEVSSPEVIWDNGLHQLLKYFIAGMVIFLIGSASLVDSGALKALVTVFVD